MPYYDTHTHTNNHVIVKFNLVRVSYRSRLPYIRKASESPDSHELVCALMLLSVVRQTGHLPGGDGGGLWREVISYDALRTTAVHTNDEVGGCAVIVTSM